MGVHVRRLPSTKDLRQMNHPFQDRELPDGIPKIFKIRVPLHCSLPNQRSICWKSSKILFDNTSYPQKKKRIVLLVGSA
ncbi:unnamed protein product [Ilex paraguariensis]|uniref:Uncharacterized protein n=1 Tax=Ilex paraguariensis TaxID=185542 RepID=A0ABC8UXA0_9AQUA